MFRAADYYDSQRTGLGDDFLAVVEQAIDDIAESPLRWQLVDDRHHRRVLRRFPFSIYYRRVGPMVVIVAIAHHKRQPDYWRHR